MANASEIASTTWNQADASNTGTTPPNIDGTRDAPSFYDNSVRAVIGGVKREYAWRSFSVTSGGSANAQTLTYSEAPAAYYNPQLFGFIAGFDNTGSVTLNVNALGAKTIKKIGNGGTGIALDAHDIMAGDRVSVVYDGTDLILVSNSTRPGVKRLQDFNSVGTGGTYTIDNSVITAPFSTLEVLLFSLSHSGGVNRFFTIEISSDNGSTWSATQTISDSVAAAVVTSGTVTIRNCRGDVERHLSALTGATNLSADMYNQPAYQIASAGTGSIDALRFAPSGGAAFDGGNIALYGIY